MYLIRNIFQAKPGKAKALANIFKKVAPHMTAAGFKSTRILIDSVATYWTVVVEAEMEDPSSYCDMPEKLREKPEVQEAMAGYMDLVEGGSREIMKIEFTYSDSDSDSDAE
jgi:hypothetical protein